MTATSLPDIDFENRHDVVLIPAVLVGLFLATIAFSLRMHVRRVILRRVGLDDYVLIASYVVYVGLTFLFIANVSLVVIDGAAPEFTTSFGMSQVWLLFSLILTALVRAAIATFFVRILPDQPAYGFHRLAIVATSIIFALYVSIGGFVMFFQCGTKWGNIDGAIEQETCISLVALSHIGLSITILTTLADWLMILIPIVVVYKSAMSVQAKMSALAVIIIGLRGSVVSIVRLPYYDRALVYGPQSFHNYFVWQVLAIYENCIGITAISLAALRPLLRRVKMFGNDEILDGHGLDGAGNGNGKNVVFLQEFQVDTSKGSEKSS